MRSYSSQAMEFPRLLAWLVLASVACPAVAATPAYDAQVINADPGGGLAVPGDRTLLLLGSDATIPRSTDVVSGQGTLRRSADGGGSWQLLPTHSSRHFTSALAVPGGGDLVLVGERIVRLVRRSH